MLDHATRAGVVGGERQSNVAEAGELRREVPRGSIQILGGIEGIGRIDGIDGIGRIDWIDGIGQIDGIDGIRTKTKSQV